MQVQYGCQATSWQCCLHCLRDYFPCASSLEHSICRIHSNCLTHGEYQIFFSCPLSPRRSVRKKNKRRQLCRCDSLPPTTLQATPRSLLFKSFPSRKRSRNEPSRFHFCSRMRPDVSVRKICGKAVSESKGCPISSADLIRSRLLPVHRR